MSAVNRITLMFALLRAFLNSVPLLTSAVFSALARTKFAFNKLVKIAAFVRFAVLVVVSKFCVTEFATVLLSSPDKVLLLIEVEALANEVLLLVEIDVESDAIEVLVDALVEPAD
ncbi:hypothetical protein [Limosilactobacillus reuteri]|uniref:hypothetical protein n=1 Tax=Limosilactobacillus reuteri TaxID=1598 RepID=UPI001C5BC521|nr:hypothetical protein [Limosilactobacillus reuteri]MBW3349751.1 hypothetical protein [Limosilactobacillus reuteri]UUW67603.1 hypothetical protein NUJ10_06145 [Limosilactobacillus reuteri]